MKMKINVEPIRMKILRLQGRIANCLNTRFNKYPGPKKRMAVIVFCFCFSALSLRLLVNAVLLKQMDHPTLMVQRLLIPPVVPSLNSSGASADSYRNLEHFKAWLYNLSKTDTSAYRQIIAGSPHLLDSINQIEAIYLETYKK